MPRKRRQNRVLPQSYIKSVPELIKYAQYAISTGLITLPQCPTPPPCPVLPEVNFLETYTYTWNVPSGPLGSHSTFSFSNLGFQIHDYDGYIKYIRSITLKNQSSERYQIIYWNDLNEFSYTMNVNDIVTFHCSTPSDLGYQNVPIVQITPGIFNGALDSEMFLYEVNHYPFLFPISATLQVNLIPNYHGTFVFDYVVEHYKI